MLTITAVKAETPTVTTLFMEGPGAAAFERRRAGQFALLKLQRGDEWSNPHPFTIVCAPEDAALRMSIKAVGPFTTSLRTLPVGTPAALQGPLGSFCKGIDEDPDVVLIAGGIGVTPFLSVLRHWRNTKATRKVTLVWANNEPADIFALDELRAMTAELALKLVHVVWRPGESGLPKSDARMVWENGLLDADTLRRNVELSGAAIYLCGSPNMQGFVFPHLQACGVDTATVKVEKFVPYHSPQR